MASRIRPGFYAHYDNYLKIHGNPRVRMFWHGSKNENWFSICQKGLLLNPDAQITGKMFGNGIYFAPDPQKSWGYISAHGTRWAHGNSNTAFMALYATAYGKPYDVYSWSSTIGGMNETKLHSIAPYAGCLHARKDKGMLHADEVVFYREDQVTISYLVQFKNV